MLFFYDVFQIFVGFILGIYFERWNESRNDKKWSKKALLSILHDIDSSANAFKDVIEIDNNNLLKDKNLLNEMSKTNNKTDFFKALTKILINEDDGRIWSNMTHEEVNYIELNSTNYEDLIRNSERNLLDNRLKSMLYWLYIGEKNIYLRNLNQINQQEFLIRKKLSEYGFSKNYQQIDKDSDFDKNEIIAIFDNYFILREKDLLIKKEIFKSLNGCSNRIRKNLKKPIISDVYKDNYQIKNPDYSVGKDNR
tara:strand:+ start:808 stop:1563 length:756 start_codon:yes stop_codon:yes gene_type:complete